MASRFVFTATTQFPESDSNGLQIFTVDEDGENLRQLTRGVEHRMGLEFSRDGKRIAFVSLQASAKIGIEYEISVMDMNGANLRALVQDLGDTRFVAFHPDGHQLLFSRMDWAADPMKNGVYVLDCRENEPTPMLLAETGIFCFHLRFSFDGNQIVFLCSQDLYEDGVRCSKSPLQIHVMNADGTLRRPVAESSETLPRRAPLFTPDGKSLVFEVEKKLWTVNLDGGMPRLLFDQGRERNGEALMHPGGKKIAFMQVNNDSRKSHEPFVQLFISNLDGSERVCLSSPFRKVHHATFSPDGSQIAFVAGKPKRQRQKGSRIKRNRDRRHSKGWDRIYVAALDGSGLRAVTPEMAVIDELAWGPKAE